MLSARVTSETRPGPQGSLRSSARCARSGPPLAALAPVLRSLRSLRSSARCARSVSRSAYDRPLIALPFELRAGSPSPKRSDIAGRAAHPGAETRSRLTMAPATLSTQEPSTSRANGKWKFARVTLSATASQTRAP